MRKAAFGRLFCTCYDFEQKTKSLFKISVAEVISGNFAKH